MVVCFETFTFTLEQRQCKSFKQVLQKASKICCQPQSQIKLFFVHSNLSETQIDSDSDLLSLKYLVKKGPIVFKILVSKSKGQVQSELIESEVSDFLSWSYDNIAQQEIQRQLTQQLQSYLKQLYQKIMIKEAKDSLKKIENEETSRYMSNLMEDVSQKIAKKRRCSIQNRPEMARSSLQSELLKRKQNKIDTMVKRILESMMPVMVKQLSHRIIEELTDSKELATMHTLRSIDQDQNLQYI